MIDTETYRELAHDTPARLKAEELMNAVPITFAMPADIVHLVPDPIPLGFLKEIVTAETYFRMRAKIADELERIAVATADAGQVARLPDPAVWTWPKAWGAD